MRSYALPNIDPVMSDEGLLVAVNAWLRMPFGFDDGRAPGHMLEPGAGRRHADNPWADRFTSRLALDCASERLIMDFTLEMDWQRSCSADPNAKPGDPNPTISHLYLDIRLQAAPRRKHMGAKRRLDALPMAVLSEHSAQLMFVNDSRQTPAFAPIDRADNTTPPENLLKIWQGTPANAADNFALTWRWTVVDHLVTPDLHVQLVP